MKEFIEKLIGMLEEYKKSSEDDYIGLGCEDDFGAMNAYGHAIEIVNQLAEEYKDKDCSKCSRRSWYQKGYADGYTKAIDEFLKLGSEEFKSDSIGYAQLITIAEQLTVSEIQTTWKQNVMERFEKVE